MKTKPKLTDRQQEILDIIIYNPDITYREICEEMEINMSSVQGFLRALTKKGYIKGKVLSPFTVIV